LTQSEWHTGLAKACQSLVHERGVGGVTVDELVEATHAQALASLTPQMREQLVDVSAGSAPVRQRAVQLSTPSADTAPLSNTSHISHCCAFCCG